MEINQLSPQRVASLVNRLAAAKEAADLAKEAYDQLKLEAIALLGEGVYASKTVQVSIKPASRPILNQAKAKGFLTPSQLSRCFTTSYYTDLRIKLLAQAA